MNTKRLPFQASTLCAGGTLLVLGSFLALNLAGCGGGGGGIVNPTSNPNITPTQSSASVRFQLQNSNLQNASGGTIRLTGNGRTYNGTANSSGLISIGSVQPGTYDVVFTVIQNSTTSPGSGGVPTPTPIVTPTTTSVTISAATSSTGAQYFTLIQGSTNNSNPYTITGRVLLNPTDSSDPDGNSSTANCSSSSTPVTAALNIVVRDLNSANGTPIIATTVRAQQPTGTSATQEGVYSISIPYRPRSLQVTVSSAADAPFAGISASTTFPATTTTLSNIDVCTNNSTTVPQPAVTATPSPTPFATATTIGTAVATATRTPAANPTSTPTIAPTSTPVATATPQPTNTPINGGTGTGGGGNNPTSTPQPTATSTSAPTTGV